MSEDWRNYCGNENCRRFLIAGVCAACQPGVVEERLARAEAALSQIEMMPVRIQTGNHLAENPQLTHDIAAKALRLVS